MQDPIVLPPKEEGESSSDDARYRSSDEGSSDDDYWDYDRKYYQDRPHLMSPYIKKHRAHMVHRPITASLKTTSLHWAAQNGYADMLKVILQQVSINDFYKQFLDLKVRGAKTALAVAAEWGRDDIVKMLIEAGAFVDAPSPYSTSYTKRCRASHQRDVDRDHPIYYGERQRQFCTPLGHAIRSGEESTAMILASHTEHLNNSGFTRNRRIVSPLTLAVRYEMHGVIKTLLSRGYKENPIFCVYWERESHPLCVASSIKNNQEMIKLLIDHGMGLNSSGSWNWYPLTYAIHTERFENAFYLLSCEEPDYAGDRIEEALRLSILHDRNLEITKALVERLNSFGKFGCLIEIIRETSPSRKRSETICYVANLLASGLNKAYIREDQTYVHWVIEYSKHNAEFGADLTYVMGYAGDNFDINAKDKDGLTGLDLANKYCKRKTIIYLESKMNPVEEPDEETDGEADDEADEGDDERVYGWFGRRY